MLYCKIIYVFCANHANALNVLWRKNAQHLHAVNVVFIVG